MAVKDSGIYAGRVDSEWCEPYLQQKEDVRGSSERLPSASATVHARCSQRTRASPGKGLSAVTQGLLADGNVC